MTAPLLVAYASRAGSTAGVAEAIGETLCAGGAPVEVRPMREVTDIAPYGAVVAGSAIQDKRWLPEAMQFVHAQRSALRRKPFAAFLVCMTLAMPNNPYEAQVRTWLDPVSALVTPVSKGCFAGALDISKIPSLRTRLMFRVSVKMGVWQEGDHRDWNAIRAWAEDLTPRLAA